MAESNPNTTQSDAATDAPQDESPEQFASEDTDRAQAAGEPQKKRMGAPLKLDEALITKVANAIRNGSYMETAAAYCGIHRDTLYEWMKRGAAAQTEARGGKKIGKREALYLLFIEELDKALAESEIRDVIAISRAVQDGDWRAAAFRLSRKFPDRWAEKTETKVTGTGAGGAVKVENYNFTLKLADTVDAAKLEEEEVNAGLDPNA